jgi:hypothetical protein
MPAPTGRRRPRPDPGALHVLADSDSAPGRGWAERVRTPFRADPEPFAPDEHESPVEE